MYITSRMKMLISCSLISYVASTFPIFASNNELRDLDETFSHKSSTLPSTDTSVSEIKLLEEEVDNIPIPPHTNLSDMLVSGITTVAKIALSVLGNGSNLNNAQYNSILLPGNIRSYIDEKGQVIFSNESIPRQGLYSQISYAMQIPGQETINSWIAIPPRQAFDGFPVNYMDSKSTVATSSLGLTDKTSGDDNALSDLIFRFSLQNVKKGVKYVLTSGLKLTFLVKAAELSRDNSEKKYNIESLNINIGGTQYITNNNIISPKDKLHAVSTDPAISVYEYDGFDELTKNEKDNSIVLTLVPIGKAKFLKSEIDEMSNAQTRPLNKRELQMLKARYQKQE